MDNGRWQIDGLWSLIGSLAGIGYGISIRRRKNNMNDGLLRESKDCRSKNQVRNAFLHPANRGFGCPYSLLMVILESSTAIFVLLLALTMVVRILVFDHLVPLWTGMANIAIDSDDKEEEADSCFDSQTTIATETTREREPVSRRINIRDQSQSIQQTQLNLLNAMPDAAFFAPRPAWGRLLEPGTSEKTIIGATSATATTAAAAAAEAAADSTTAAAAGKRKQAPTADEQDDSDSMPVKKKPKFSDDNDKNNTQPTMAVDSDNAGKDDKKTKLSTTTGQTAAAAADDHNRRPFYVPRHFPPFPRPADAVGRTVLDDDTLLGAVQSLQQQQAARKKKNQDRTGPSRTPSSRATTRRGAKMVPKNGVVPPIVNVRSALVRLGTPWGSGWDKDSTAAAASDSMETTALPNDNNNNYSKTSAHERSLSSYQNRVRAVIRIIMICCGGGYC